MRCIALPPFYPNTFEDLHCFQCSLKMALESFSSDLRLSLAELFFLTGHTGDKLTWPLRMSFCLGEVGFDVVYMDVFDLASFVTDPRKALTTTYGNEVALAQLKGSNIQAIIKDAELLLSSKRVDKRFCIPELNDLTSLLSKGYIAICNVNSRILDLKEGYSGHFVLVYDARLETGRLMIHNPGLPPSPSSVVDFEKFMLAWSYSGREYRNILAVKPLMPIQEIRENLRAMIKPFHDFVDRS